MPAPECFPVEEAELVKHAMSHVRHQAASFQRVAKRLGITIGVDDVAWNSVPVAVYWANPNAFTVKLHGYSAAASRIRYRFQERRSAGVDYEILPVAPEHGVFPQPWMTELDFVFDASLSIGQDDAIRDAKCQAVLRQHLAVRGFFQRLSWISDLAAVTRHMRANSGDIAGRVVDPQTYYRLCVVMALSAVETLLHDCFYAFSNHWFQHLPEGRLRRRAIKTVVRRLTPRRDRRRVWRMWRSTYSNDAFLEFIRPAGRSGISFQDWKAAKWAYKAFFGVALPALFEHAEKATWDTFLFVSDHRHSTIHPGRPEDLTRQQVDDVLETLRTAQCTLLDDMLTREIRDSSLRL